MDFKIVFNNYLIKMKNIIQNEAQYDQSELDCKINIYQKIDAETYNNNDKINDLEETNIEDEFESLKYRDIIPKILDSYEYGKFHTKVILALGTTWVLDGYEVSLISVLSGVLIESYGFKDHEIGLIGTMYLLGAVIGSLVFGSLASDLGRKKLFNITLIIYSFSVICICFNFDKIYFMFFRFLTGVSVGGEYSAIFSAIDELLPAYVRGRVDLIIDGTWHFGSCIAALLSFIVLDNNKNDFFIRMLFILGAICALPVIYLRSFIPESPRWLLLKGKIKDCIITMREINNQCEIRNDSFISKNPQSLNILTDDIIVKDVKSNTISLKEIIKRLILENTRRFFYAFALMSTQAFFYSGVFYTYTMILKTFDGIEPNKVGLYLIPLSTASFCGPILIGSFFDTFSRKKMIFICNLTTFLMLIIIAFNFKYKYSSFLIEQILWFITFIFASPGSSAAHLTVSEIFPIEMRSQALSFFFSIGYGVGAVFSPYIFGLLIESKSREMIFYGYILAGFVMGFSGIIALIIGVDSERKSLEEITDDYKKEL